MKTILSIIVIALLLGSCSKENQMNVNKYEYFGSQGTYVVKLKTVDVRNVEVNPSHQLSEGIGADDIFEPLLEMVSISSNNTVTLTIVKNGVVISEKTYHK